MNIENAADTPEAKIYCKLLHRHLKAAQSGDEDRQRHLQKMIEDLESEFPEECKAYRRMFGDDTE